MRGNDLCYRPVQIAISDYPFYMCNKILPLSSKV